MFWEVFLECSRCGKRHLNVTVAFSPSGTAYITAKCCEVIAHELTWEDAVAGATRQEEAFLLATREGRKQLDARFRAEN